MNIIKKFFTTILSLCLISLNAKAQWDVFEWQDTLKESYVTAVKEKIVNTTQTGLVRLSSEKLKAGYAAFGTPDLIKSLQLLPGVAAGNELTTGLFVHGGDGHDNLFLLDGVPIYNISHFGGFFSSFNTDVVNGLDFYKSGFPARYGGMMSSVVDVDTREGDMNEYHGNVSLGLIDGRIQVEGPIVKGKTSFNFGIRRSWMDYIVNTAIWVARRRGSINDQTGGSYYMRDVNAKLTHKFSETSKLNVNFYHGRDRLTAQLGETGLGIDLHTLWGSTLGSVDWQKKFNNKHRLKLQGYFSQSLSDTGYNLLIKPESGMQMDMDDSNISFVRDFGVKADADWYPNSQHHVRYGIGLIQHSFASNRTYSQTQSTEGGPATTDGKEGVTHPAFDPSVYIEDEFFIRYNLTLNAGLRYSLFSVDGKTWQSLEPRCAFKWLIAHNYSAKLSLSRMSQNSHMVSAMYVDLPMDCWMPSTTTVRPMISDQIAGGIYTTPFKHVTINVEGWYKTMDHILSYNGNNAFYPPITDWENSFTEGEGRTYGLETEATYDDGKMSFSAYYTLSRSERRFQAYYPEWFRDRNDNLHKLNLVAQFKIGRHADVFLNWNYHSGNRVTFPTHVLSGEDGTPSFIYDAPYNTELPAYHRLDMGFNFNKKTKRDHELTFNLSIYNVYNHMNASLAMLDHDSQTGEISGKAYGLIPIIPTMSIIYKF